MVEPLYAWRAEMRVYERDKLRRELDEALLPFRLVRKRKGGGTGWLRTIRQATGVPVDEVARRLGMCRWEVHRLEESEANSRIMLASLSRAAKGLGCELVYALIPREGTLEDLAAKQRGVREAARKLREEKREAKRKPWLEAIGWQDMFLNSLRTILRRQGVRVRPRQTERGVAKQEAEFKETMKLAALADQLGPLFGGSGSGEQEPVTRDKGTRDLGLRDQGLRDKETRD